MRVFLVAVFVSLPSLAFGQMTYEQRAALAKDPVWQDRVGIAAQQQAVVAHGENPTTCCQTAVQEALADGERNLCTVTIAPGVPTAPAWVLTASADRHNARVRLALDLSQNPMLWAQRMATTIASDACVPGAAFTDAELQSYMAHAWDIWSLSPELSATPVEPPPPLGILERARPPIDRAPNAPKLPPE
jgi:hypothetical protein